MATRCQSGRSGTLPAQLRKADGLQNSSVQIPEEGFGGADRASAFSRIPESGGSALRCLCSLMLTTKSQSRWADAAQLAFGTATHCHQANNNSELPFEHRFDAPATLPPNRRGPIPAVMG